MTNTVECGSFSLEIFGQLLVLKKHLASLQMQREEVPLILSVD